MKHNFNISNKASTKEVSVFQDIEKNSDSNMWINKIAVLWNNAQSRHKGKLRLKHKDDGSFWTFAWKITSWIVFLFTFGKGMDMLRNYTTFGRYIFIPAGDHFVNLKTSKQWSLLAHEIAHVDHMYFYDADAQDFRNASALRRTWWQTLLLPFWLTVFSLGYLLIPLPIFFSPFRAWVEYYGFKRSLMRLIIEDLALRLKMVDNGLKNENLAMIRDLKPSSYKGNYERFFYDWTYGKMLPKAMAQKWVAEMEEEAVLACRKSKHAHDIFLLSKEM